MKIVHLHHEFQRQVRQGNLMGKRFIRKMLNGQIKALRQQKTR